MKKILITCLMVVLVVAPAVWLAGCGQQEFSYETIGVTLTREVSIAAIEGERTFTVNDFPEIQLREISHRFDWELGPFITFILVLGYPSRQNVIDSVKGRSLVLVSRDYCY